MTETVQGLLLERNSVHNNLVTRGQLMKAGDHSDDGPQISALHWLRFDTPCALPLLHLKDRGLITLWSTVPLRPSKQAYHFQNINSI